MLTKRTSEQTSPAGRRVLVTRAADQAATLAVALHKIGVDPIVVPTIEIVPPASFNELDQAIAELDRVDYLILTSVNAVNAFFDRLTAQGHSTLDLAAIKTVAVGPKSAEAIAARGVIADLVPDDYRAEGFFAFPRAVCIFF
jgi:uroporphyrinogen III methyltransferase/synthase